MQEYFKIRLFNSITGEACWYKKGKTIRYYKTFKDAKIAETILLKSQSWYKASIFQIGGKYDGYFIQVKLSDWYCKQLTNQ